MNVIKNKIRQWKYKLKHDFLSIENVVLVVAVAMCLMWTYQSVASMTRNWELAERLNTEKKTLELTKIEVEMAELENEYYASSEYQELSARRLAGKQLSGEHMLYMPENTEEAKNKHKIVAVENDIPPEEKEYSNIEKWFMYLLP